MKNLILIAAIFFISSCQPYMANFLPARPAREFSQSMEDGSPEFAQGWKDGCESGMSTASNTFYKMFYRINKVDGYKMVSSDDYSTAWNNAFWYCLRSDYVKQKSSKIWSSTFGGYK